ncbi:hypothetical protein EDD15DRAFT_2201083 [Pisolithus albus]|nr:hypothetical protein EDD15DRAFT_2201083 [Pisolithus albus]
MATACRDMKDVHTKTMLEAGVVSLATNTTDNGQTQWKSDVSSGDRSPPTRPTVGQPNTRMEMGRATSAQATGYSDRKPSVSTGDKSPPMRQMVAKWERSASGRIVNTRGHVTELSRITTQFATRFLSMVRTKQTAGRTTSGYAKPAQLSGCKRCRLSSTENLTSRSPFILPALSGTSTDDNIQGIKYICDVCIDVPESIATRLSNQEISFKCPACHEKEERATHSKPMLYFVYWGWEFPASAVVSPAQNGHWERVLWSSPKPEWTSFRSHGAFSRLKLTSVWVLRKFLQLEMESVWVIWSLLQWEKQILMGTIWDCLQPIMDIDDGLMKVGNGPILVKSLRIIASNSLSVKGSMV